MEETEVRGHAAWTGCASAEFRSTHGVLHRSDEYGHLFAAGALDVLALNTVLVTGSGPPPPRTVIEGWKETFRSAGTRRFFVQVSPAADLATVDARLREAGLRPYNRWARLWRDLDAIPEQPEAPRVERLEGDGAAEFGRLVAEAFDMPRPVASWLAQSGGLPGWHHYGAIEGDEAIGVAALVAGGPLGWLSFAATRANRRGRGAQTALILKRLSEARALGLERVTVETAEDKPEKPAPSFRNLRRLGFRFAYHRPNYLFEFAPTGPS